MKLNGSSNIHEDLQPLCGSDIFVWTKMNEHLFELRKNLFPML